METMRRNRNDRGYWAMGQLKDYGTNALLAVPELLEFMKVGDDYGYRAEQCMKHITPEALTNAPVR